jgi:hypothetical protein
MNESEPAPVPLESMTFQQLYDELENMRRARVKMLSGAHDQREHDMLLARIFRVRALLNKNRSER